MSTLFSSPKIPPPPVAAPPAPPKNTALDAELAQLGRRQGLLAAMFGYKKPSGPSSGKKLTGQ